MKKCLLFILASLFVYFADAHTVNYSMANANQASVGWYYTVLGFTHILPYGIDHIVFIVGLYLLQPDLLSVVKQATVFTVAHSITLALTMLDYIQPPVQSIEIIIALSILFVAVENLCLDRIYWWRYGIVFLFGLIHGCGFASALHQTGLPPQATIWALFTFNVGVELGQVAVVVLCYLLIGKFLSNKIWYRKFIVVPVSCCIALIATYWLAERM